MKVYNYSAITGAFTYEEEADPDPLIEGRWLIPACATTIAPPSASADEIVAFSESIQEWVIIKPTPPPYFVLRAREYPSFIEYIDGVVKNDYDQINKYISKCLAVKAKYPKPGIIDYEI